MVCNRLRQASGDDRYWAPLDQREKSLARSIMQSIYVPFGESPHAVHNGLHLTVYIELLLYDRMALLLDVWYALLVLRGKLCLGILTHRQDRTAPRHPLPRFPGLPHHLHGQARFQHAADRSHLPRHRHRHDHSRLQPAFMEPVSPLLPSHAHTLTILQI